MHCGKVKVVCAVNLQSRYALWKNKTFLLVLGLRNVCEVRLQPRSVWFLYTLPTEATHPLGAQVCPVSLHSLWSRRPPPPTHTHARPPISVHFFYCLVIEIAHPPTPPTPGALSPLSMQFLYAHPGHGDISPSGVSVGVEGWVVMRLSGMSPGCRATHVSPSSSTKVSTAV